MSCSHHPPTHTHTLPPAPSLPPLPVYLQCFFKFPSLSHTHARMHANFAHLIHHGDHATTTTEHTRTHADEWCKKDSAVINVSLTSTHFHFYPHEKKSSETIWVWGGRRKKKMEGNMEEGTWKERKRGRGAA